MRKTLKILLIFVAFSACTDRNLHDGDSGEPESENSIVRGFVLDESHQFLEGVTVTLNHSDSQTTDSLGSYRFENLSGTNVALEAALDGYYSRTTNLIVSDNSETVVNFVLEEMPAVITQEITIATYNVLDFERENAYEEIAEFVAVSNIDIIVMQEIAPGTESTFSNALAYEGVTMPYVGFSEYNTDYTPYDAIAYFSKFPVSDETNMFREWLTDPNTGLSEDCTGLRPIYRFKVSLSMSQAIWFYGAHLKAGGDTDDLERRRAQAYATEQFIISNHDPTTEDIVILGDMNSAHADDDADNGPIGFLTLKSDNPGNTENDGVAVNLSEIPSEYTYPSWPSLLDHIILLPNAHSNYISGSVCVPHPAGDPSDHYPVMLRLSYP